MIYPGQRLVHTGRKIITASRLSSVKAMGTWSVVGAVGAATVAGLAVLCNLPTNPFVKSPEKATLDYLSSARLRTFDSEPREFQASELWEKNGAVIMAVRRPGCPLCREEALGLSSLRPQLDAHGVPLYAVVHETLGVAEFQPFFKGEIFLDKERHFYGPVERRMGLSGFFRLSVLWTIIKNRRQGVDGNMKGEGRILGGLFVIGPGSQGILFEHREKEFGDYADKEEVLKAVAKIQNSHGSGKL